jgi:hypothetical protein
VAAEFGAGGGRVWAGDFSLVGVFWEENILRFFYAK